MSAAGWWRLIPGAAVAVIAGAFSWRAAAAHAVLSSPRPTCSTGQVGVAAMHKSLGAALGHTGRWYEVRAIGGPSCSLRGYPGVVLLDTDRHPLGPHVQHSGYMIPTRLPRREVLVDRQHHAYFALEFQDGTGTGRCRPVPYLRVTLPGARGSIVIQARIEDCRGRIDVSPVLPSPAIS
jgi:hypothetical protein